jgi:alpha-glucosidase (family GH31 glycosyl hydrolase)
MERSDQVETWLHPEALSDEAFQRHELDLETYRPFEGDLASVADTTDTAATFATPGGATLRVESYGPNLLRLRAAPPDVALAATATERLGLVTPPPPQPLTQPTASGVMAVAAGEWRVEIGPTSHEIAVRTTDGEPMLQSVGGGFRFSSEPAEFGGSRFFARFRLASERLSGFGGRIMRPDRIGAFADMYAVTAGQHSGDYGGFPVPFFLSTRGYGVFLNNPWPHVYFDIGRTTSDEWFVHAPGGDCDFFVIRGPEWPRIVSTFTQLVGRLPKPRRWWLGLWTGTRSLARAEEVIELGRKHRQGGHPCDAIQVDGAWRGGQGAGPANDLEWNPDFGDGPAMVKLLKAMGIRTVLHADSRVWRDETAQRGVAEGWLRRQGDGVAVRMGDPEADARYRPYLEARNRDGIAGWLLDEGERVSGEVLPGIPSRNLYGTLWARAVAATGSDVGDPARVVFARGGGIGGQRHAIAWSGGTRVGVDFFQEDLSFILSAGLAGFPLASCDLGGACAADEFSAPHNRAFDPDNLARRVCQGLFLIPTPRTLDDAKEPPKLPWNCPPAIRDLYAEMLRQRYAMTPYWFTYLVHAHLTGEPIVRPMAYAHREDRVACGLDDQLLLGDWLLVAPVLGKGQESRAVYLPAGRWLSFWNDEEYRGPTTIRVPTPLERLEGLPVFVRSGAILPTQDPVNTLNDRPPAAIQLDLYPDADSEFLLLDSPTQRTRIRCRLSGRRVRVDIENGVGFARHFRLRLHGVASDISLAVHVGAGGTAFTHEIERWRPRARGTARLSRR